MKTTFVDSNPHAPGRPTLDGILDRADKRLMIACAFCTGAGVTMISRHVSKLNRPGSCLVVSSEPPTDIEAVNGLAGLAPGRVWFHQTGKLPHEKNVGIALMHSKLFYAETLNECWLWVGSHNLTARALTGANAEAAVLMAGHPDEDAFVAARKHIECCRDEAFPAPIVVAPQPEGDGVDIVVIHAETDDVPAESVWHARLGLTSAEFDWLLTPVADVRLHLYRRGELALGWQNRMPLASYRGTLTGLNFTEAHPEHPGIAARWGDEHYNITEQFGTLFCSREAPPKLGFVTQAAINIEGISPSDEVLMSSAPKAAANEGRASFLLGRVDDDMRRYFTRSSIDGDRIVYELKRRGEIGWKLPLEELRQDDLRELQAHAESQQFALWEDSPRNTGKMHHPLIHRMKFRLHRSRLL